jgi:hypothetical protein
MRRNQQDLGVCPEMVGARGFHLRGDFGACRGLSARIIVCTVGLSLALGAMEARAAQAAPARAIVQTASDSSDAIQDLGALTSAPDSDNPTPASTSTVSSAEPVPELPTWAMILLCFAGLGLAGLKRGRKDRLSPGID